MNENKNKNKTKLKNHYFAYMPKDYIFNLDFKIQKLNEIAFKYSFKTYKELLLFFKKNFTFDETKRILKNEGVVIKDKDFRFLIGGNNNVNKK